MQRTNVQRENTITVESNPTGYQHSSDASAGRTSYGRSIPPNMGIDADHCLKNIANRKVLVTTKTWSNAMAPALFAPNANQIGSYVPFLKVDFPFDVLNAAPGFIADKVRNWWFLHCTLDIEIKFNANRFQQGAVWVRYNPRGEVLSAIDNDLRNHLRSITSFTGQMLNLCDGDTVNMKLPYCCEYETFNLVNSTIEGGFGEIIIDILSPLQGGSTSEAVDVSVFARFEDVKVYAPTPTGVPTQRSERMVAHSGESRSEEATEKAELGVVSTPARAVAAISDAIGLIPIPKVQLFSKGLGWLSRRVEQFALAHGLSKPEGVDLPMVIANQPGKGMNHVEGLDGGTNLGLIQDNEIEPFQSVVCSDDENSFAYISMRPWLEFKFKFGTDSIAGSILDIMEFSNVGEQNVDSTFCSCSQFVTTHFALIHTSVKFTLKAIKTFAHSGRLQVMVSPFNAGPLGLEDIATTMSYQWDLAESTEMSFTVPWLSNELFLAVQQKPFLLHFLVLNELQAASNVPENIEILVFASFGDDYQVAIPAYTPITGYAASPVGTQARDPGTRGLEMVQSCPEPMVAHSGAPDNTRPMDVAEDFHVDPRNIGMITCIGESAQSVRQVIKRNSEDVLSTTFDSDRYVLTSDVHTGLPTTTVGGVRPSLVGSFARIFRFWSGSLRYKAVFVTGYDLTVNFNDTPGSSEFYQNSTLNPLVEFTVPFYSHTRKKVPDYSSPNPTHNITIRSLGADLFNGAMLKMYQSAGDDFNFHFLVGPPVIQNLYA